MEQRTTYTKFQANVRLGMSELARLRLVEAHLQVAASCLLVTAWSVWLQVAPFPKLSCVVHFAAFWNGGQVSVLIDITGTDSVDGWRVKHEVH